MRKKQSFCIKVNDVTNNTGARETPHTDKTVNRTREGSRIQGNDVQPSPPSGSHCSPRKDIQQEYENRDDDKLKEYNVKSILAKFNIHIDVIDPESVALAVQSKKIPQLIELSRCLDTGIKKHQNYKANVKKQKDNWEEKTEETSRQLDGANMAHEDRYSRILEIQTKSTKNINDLNINISEIQTVADKLKDQKIQNLEVAEKLKSELEKNEKESELNNWESLSALKLLSLMQGAILELIETRNRLVSLRGEFDLKRRIVHNRFQELKGNLRVFVRIRQLILQERLDGCDKLVYQIARESTLLSIATDGNQKSLSNNLALSGLPSSNDTFTFDKVFGTDATQEQIFVEVSTLVQSALDGFNVSLFAYGQTGSGKTFTMDGDWSISDARSLEDQLQPTAGITPRSVQLIFNSMCGLIHKGWHYGVKLSVVEIYNETVRDLLSPSSSSTLNSNANSNTNCDIRLDQKGNTTVVNLTQLVVRNAKEVFTGLLHAARHRATASTACNERSSRSHCVVQLHIVGERSKDKKTMQSTLSLIDLAGSERLDKSLAVGDRLKEAQFINKSLSCLSDVITAIAGRKPHVPFRNSKLTLLLKDSLGGNSKTLMFVNITELKSSRSESVNSLRFAAKANSCILT